MSKLTTWLKSLIKNKRVLISAAFGLLILLTFLVLIISSQKSLDDNKEEVPIITPPVVKQNNGLELVKTFPQSGERETFDNYSQTFFEFSADLDENSAAVNVSPYIALSLKVYSGDKRTLVVEPKDRPWSDGVEYTLTVMPGLKGVHGEELNQKIDYVFSVVEPEVFLGGDPPPGD